MVSPFLPGGLVVDRFDERVGKGIDVVRFTSQPFGFPATVLTKERAARTGRDHRQTARHRLEENLPERLVYRRAHEQVRARQAQRESSWPANRFEKTPSTANSLATVYAGAPPPPLPAIRPQIRRHGGLERGRARA